MVTYRGRRCKDVFRDTMPCSLVDNSRYPSQRHIPEESDLCSNRHKNPKSYKFMVGYIGKRRLSLDMLVGNTSETKVAICFYKYSNRSPTAVLRCWVARPKPCGKTESSEESRLLLTLLKYDAFELEGLKERDYWRDLGLDGRLMLR